MMCYISLHFFSEDDMTCIWQPFDMYLTIQITFLLCLLYQYFLNILGQQESDESQGPTP